MTRRFRWLIDLVNWFSVPPRWLGLIAVLIFFVILIYEPQCATEPALR